MKPPVHLVNCFVTSFSFQALPDVELEDPSPIVVPSHDLEFNIDSGTSPDLPDHLIIMLNCGLQDEPDPSVPYHFQIALTGVFRIDEEFYAALENPEEGSWIMIEAGVTEMYATAREFLAMNTARGPFPTLLLPTVDFSEAQPHPVDDDEDEEEEAVPRPRRKPVAAVKPVAKTPAKPAVKAPKKPAPRPKPRGTA